MDIERLRTFLAVALRGTFSAAAHEVSMSQSGVSRQVQRLEQELGVVLFDRTEIPLALTPAGEKLLAYAQNVLGQHQALQVALKQQQPALSGDLRIAASTTPGEFLVPRLVSAFLERYPEVRPSVRILDSAEVVELLQAGAYEVGFVGAQGSSTLEYVEVLEDEIVLAVPARHPLARGAAVELEELAGQPFIEREGGSGTLRSAYEAVARRGLVFPSHRVAMVLGSTEAVVSAVRAGLGIGLVSSLALQGRSRKEVRAVRISGVPLLRPLYLAYSPSVVLQATSRAFVDFTLEHRMAAGRSGLGKKQPTSNL
ncbi:MAG: LysR family transcriptional regulator [Chloroflexi bacterium]|nr:LysR family transcriptional regulator [Chloroflexota bacterium]